MREFEYSVPRDVMGAVDAVAREAGALFIAGGTGLVDLMKLEVQNPTTLVDVNRLPLSEISETDGGALRIGAMVRNSAVAYHPLVRERYPLLSQAVLAGASAQLRNMATVGGNLMQRTRCTYFRDVHEACNKRKPGAGCAAADGVHRMHAILGTSEHCIATHASDMCVALLCLDTVVEVQGRAATRRIPLEQFHVLPGDTPHIETVLRHDELITAIEIPRPSGKRASAYRKIRDRASYEFALVSVAASLATDGKTITNARVAFGGVATKPWRAHGVEKVLTGATASMETWRAAADASVAGAAPRRHNRFKVELLKRTLIRTLAELTGVER
jgi:xanthine dehydrogenase YagS FAD-binding subunit